MSDTPPVGALEPLERLEHARTLFAHASNTMMRLVGELEQDESKTTAAAIASTAASFVKSMQTLSTLETSLEKDGTISQSIGAGAIDFDAARTEILERLARIHDRRGADGISE